MNLFDSPLKLNVALVALLAVLLVLAEATMHWAGWT